MSTDDRMETITDPALIRASDEPDERGDFPCCTAPAPVGAAVTLDLDAIEADALAALNPSRCRCTVQSGSVYSSQCPRHDPRDPGYRAPWQMPPATALALVAEVRRLTSHADGLSANLGGDLIAWAARAEAAEAEVVTLRARLAAVVDEYPHADTCGSMLTPGAGYPCSCWQADLRAALATTGEGQHVAREVFTADGIPFVSCSCTNAKSPTSSRWLTDWLIRYDPDDGEPYGEVCDCEIGDDHYATGEGE